MIAFIKGNLAQKSSDSVVIDVAGVGMRVLVPLRTAKSLPAEGEEITLQTYLAVREDALVLYGFLNKAELSFFEILMTVQGVGPKSALNILSGLAPGELAKAIQQGNVAILRSISGVGPKLAERLVVELKDKVADLTGRVEGGVSVKEITGDDRFDEAMNGLMTLGFRQQEAREALQKALKKLPPKFKVEDLVREALNNAARK